MSDTPTPASPIRSVAVFCGSRMGNDPAAHQAAAEMGAGLAACGMRLVYGGGRNGLMGVVADEALAGGGTVSGVIPDFLRGLEAAHDGVTDLEVTTTMHERKTRMYDLADAFVTIPGGLGTLDETAEVITWRQLQLHNKPIFIVDVNGWATRLRTLLDSFIVTGFAAPETRSLYEIVPDVATVLARLMAAPATEPGRADRL